MLNQKTIEKLRAGFKYPVYNSGVTITIDDIRSKQNEINAKVAELQEFIDKEQSGVANEEQKALLEQWMNEFDVKKADIERRERMIAMKNYLDESKGLYVKPEDVDAQENVNSENAIASGNTKPQASSAKNNYKIIDTRTFKMNTHDYQNIGHFALDVAKASMRGGAIPDRLRASNAASNIANETTPADGGFAVPPDFRNEIWQKVINEASLTTYCDHQTSSSNQITFPIDETTAWQTTGGIRVNWTSEGGKIVDSKPVFGEQTIKLEKLAALLPITEELMEDAPAVSNYIRSKVPQVIAFALNSAILNGTGTGQPNGILSSPALVSVPKDSGQAADTITYNNIISMWSAMYPAGRSKAIWIANPSIAKNLMEMTYPSTMSTIPVFMPPNGLHDKPYSTLLGRPIIETEACEAIGSKGDLLLCDLSQYILAMKTVGMRADVSMHLYFDYDIMTFRFILRIGGAPWWKNPITARDGVTKYSAFVALDERA